MWWVQITPGEILTRHRRKIYFTRRTISHLEWSLEGSGGFPNSRLPNRFFVQKSDSRQCFWIPLLESIQQFRATKSDENWFHTTHTCNSTWIRSFLCDGLSYTSKGRSNCLNIDQLLSFQWHILWMLQTLSDTVQHHYDIWAPVLYWK